MANRINCTSCGLPIKGKVHRWAQRPMHARCYRYFTAHVIKRENFEKKIRTGLSKHPSRRSSMLTSLLRRIFS
jgi:hypothetical protein